MQDVRRFFEGKQLLHPGAIRQIHRVKLKEPAVGQEFQPGSFQLGIVIIVDIIQPQNFVTIEQ